MKGCGELKPKQLVGVGLAAAILIGMCFIPGTEALSAAGIRTICMLVAFLVMLVAGSFRLMYISFILLGLMPILGVAPTISEAAAGFGNPLILFVISSFGISAAFTELPISKRILVAILRRFGKNAELILLAMMCSTAIISGLVSSVPTCAVFLTIALSFLDLYDDPDDKKRTGRTFMIAIPVATMIGSITTPIASTINLLALSFLEELTGTTITFVQWMAAGIPIMIVTLPVAWWIILKVHSPAEISGEMVKKFIDGLSIPKRVTRPEINVLIITGIMMALWITSSWVRSINIVVVTLLGVCAYCIPQLNALKFDSFVKNIGWDPVFLFATLLSLGSLMHLNGVSEWMISLMPVLVAPTPLVIAFGAVLFFAMLLIIPIAPSLVPIMAPSMVALALGAGSSPEIMMLMVAICGCCCFLLPLDTVPLLSYGKGYFSFKDMFVSSLPIQAFIIIVTSLWLTVIGYAFGML